MRTKNSIYNIIGVIIFYITKIVINFVGKTVLIKVMGDQYNGIAGLFSNVISMLSIAELGIGSAIIYNLYKPVKENDTSAIKSLMCFYRKCYHIIAIIILSAGICILPFIKIIAGNVSTKESIYILYLFFLADSVVSYFFSYKRSILYVYQKNYIITFFDILYNFIMQLSQIAILLLTRNFLYYLSVMVICRLLENICINVYVNRQYCFLDDKEILPLPAKTKEDIITKVKGLMFHNIGTYIVLGTDNILISKIAGIIAVGFYSNYAAIFNPLSSILKQMITAVQASVGDLLVEKNYEKNYLIFKRLELLNFWLYSAVSISLFYVVQIFIELWLGKGYLFDDGVVFVLVLNFWQNGMRNAPAVFKGAAGIFYEDRIVPVAESIINIVISITLGVKFGIVGIFIGTFISSLCLFFYSYPFLVYKRVLKRLPREYLLSLLRFFIEWLILFLFAGVVIRMYDVMNFTTHNCIADFIVKGCFAFATVNVLLFVIYGKSDEFKFYVRLIKTKFVKKI